MLMLADSVESDRLVLLSKAHAAWKVDSVDKASRILQRLRAQTEDSATIATTPAQSNGSSSSSSSSSASAPAQRVMHPVPIVSVAPTEAPAVSATPHSHTRELANGFRVPLLAPALHTPAVTITPSVPLPTGRQPPLFLVLHNTALLHLRAGKLKLAQIFLARALEHSESLLSSLAPPSAVPATSTSPNSSPSNSRLNRLSASADGFAPQLLSPTSSRPSSSSGAASRPTPASPLLSPAASSTGPLGASSLPLYSFLLSKSLELFFTTGVVLLQLHAPTAEDAARGCSKQDWMASESCTGLRLAAQCFRHVLHTAESPAWAVLPPAMASGASTKLLCARIRFAESLSVLHRCDEIAKALSSVHPLLRGDDDAQEAEALGSAAAILLDDPYSLQHAVPHLRRALMILQQQQKEAKSAAAADPSVASVSIQLAHVWLALREAQPALDLLTPMLVQRGPDALSSSQLIQAELYAAEAFLLLRRSDDALRILVQSRNADVQRVVRACGLVQESASADPAVASAVESDEAVSLHVCSTLAFILLVQGQSDRAQRCIQLGLEASPSHPPLLQLALLQSMRSGDESVMRSLWLLKRRQTASMPIESVTVSTVVESAGVHPPLPPLRVSLPLSFSPHAMRLLFFSSFTPFMLVAFLVLMLGAMLLFLRWRLRFTHVHPPVVPFNALPLTGRVVALSLSPDHSFSKTPVDRLTLVPGLGVEGDAHKGATVQHRSRLATRGHESNLRQVHLIHAELHSLLRMQGFKGIAAGKMGENILTIGLPLIDYPLGTRLFIGAETELEITGLRNPCGQLDTYAKGLMEALRPMGADGEIRRLCGVMAVVHKGGVIRCKDKIRVQLPPTPCRKLEVV